MLSLISLLYVGLSTLYTFLVLSAVTYMCLDLRMLFASVISLS